jgi:hypothetical protein
VGLYRYLVSLFWFMLSNWELLNYLISGNMGQVCTAGSRIFVQEGIYDKFLEALTQSAQFLHSATGDPFDAKTHHGPQVSQTQFEVRSQFLSIRPASDVSSSARYGLHRVRQSGWCYFAYRRRPYWLRRILHSAYHLHWVQA